MRFDYYFSKDILRVLTEVDQTDLHLALGPEDESAHRLHRQGFEIAIERLAEMFGFSYSPVPSLQRPLPSNSNASPD